MAYGSGTSFGGGNVVYKGTVSNQTVTSLTNGTTYYFKFFTRNGTNWSAGVETSATPVPPTAATDYFRSRIDGNWGTASTWESSVNGSTSWITSTLVPTNSANSIAIQNTHTVTLAAAATAKNLTINGSLNQGSNTLTGTGTLTVSSNGTLFVGGTSNFPTGFTTTTLSSGSTVNY